MDKIIEQIIDSYAPGDLITHAYLRELLNIPELNIDNFDNTMDFVTALQASQFSYMTLVDKLRDDLLILQRYYLKNVRGDGYSLLPPKDQVSFAYEQSMDDIKKSVKQAKRIMLNIRHEDIPNEQMSKDNDLLGKMSKLAEMFGRQRN